MGVTKIVVKLESMQVLPQSLMACGGVGLDFLEKLAIRIIM